MEVRRLVGKTPDIAEAERIAEEYRLQGFTVEVLRKAQAGMALYEVWASKEPEILS
ncbi:MAG TPA: hypothetical protein VLD37_00460 [Candidatus Bilamarchaeum sp.]|nr:hypothetical protein [Candidatus Bilamarchaeum sp.]